HLLVIHFSTRLNTMDSAAARSYIEQFEKIPDQLEQVLAQRTQMKSMAKKFAMGKDIFFIGRGFDYNIALEGSLKLKEISYIHSEAYAAGELKHGTIALIEQGTLVAALCTQSTMLEKMVGNIREVKARGAMVLGIACEGSAAIGSVCDFTLYIPKNLDILIPILAIVPLQLFAYYCAVERNCDVDKPRNLAKSVTVE
ncbi:MAG: SIS domain-containing protein, partial [Spirochaetales bacterium]|nr:SIS domain-containing protein [Spirochaetales bacterium]